MNNPFYLKLEAVMKRLSWFIILFLLPLGSFANPQTDADTDRLITFHIFNGERPIADSLLDIQIDRLPEIPNITC